MLRQFRNAAAPLALRAAVLAAVVASAGCGIKGPLVLPPPKPAPAVAPVPPEPATTAPLVPAAPSPAPGAGSAPERKP